MYEELKAHDGKAVFFTLTYDEQNVPKNYLYDYEIYRSPSDYGYNNVYVDENGKERVYPNRQGEKKHKRIVPYIELQELGLDISRIIDFNVNRRDFSGKWIEKIKHIYGDYVRLFSAPVDTPNSAINPFSREFDFDSYNGEYFDITKDLTMDSGEMFDLFGQVLEDGQEADFVNNDVEFQEMRERPIMMFNSVRKKDVQDWIKRARQKRKRQSIKTGEPEQTFTFFVTSEYGPRTLRPHYHGVLFGVSASETNDMKLDWQLHHGKMISWDDVDLSKGDMSYCAKYCSKGFYEHPFCAKDFFYRQPIKAGEKTLRPFKEYHSKHYERSIEVFGIDAAIVDPTFHLMSKGLGIKWVNDNKERFVSEFEDIESFERVDTRPTVRFAYTPAIDTEESMVVEFNADTPEKEILYDLRITSNLVGDVNRILKRKEFRTDNLKSYEECIEKLFRDFKYLRVFKDKTFSYGVPKYYRTKIFNDGLRAAFAAYVQQTNVEIYQAKLRAMTASHPDWEDAKVVSALAEQERSETYERMRTVKRRLDKMYNKSKI